MSFLNALFYFLFSMSTIYIRCKYDLKYITYMSTHLSRHSEIKSVRMRWMLMLTESGKVLRAGPKDALRGGGLLCGYRAPCVI